MVHKCVCVESVYTCGGMGGGISQRRRDARADKESMKRRRIIFLRYSHVWLISTILPVYRFLQ